MSSVRDKHCYECFGILADETRLRVLDAVKKDSVNVSTLTQALGVTQPTISYHLKMLGALGLLIKEKRGRETYYSFNPDYPCKGCGVFSAAIRA